MAVIPFSYVSSLNAISFLTTFPLTENPISEGGAWLTGQRDGRDWTNVVTAGGIAYGTQSGSSPTFDDSVACLANSFSSDQYVEITAHIGGGLTPTSEISILLRCTISTGVCLCYGTNFAYDGSYSYLGRWPGFSTTNSNDYVTLASNLTNPVGSLQNGDIFQAQIVGYTMTTWHVRGTTRTLINTATDTDAAKIASGKPGFGLWNNGHAATNAIGVTRFFATSLVKNIYNTTFSATENPISESNKWSTPSQRTAFRSSGGTAFGTQVGGGFDDSIAMVAGTWSSNVEIITTISKGTTSGIQEVEHIHRCAAAGTYYEINFAHDGQYCDFVRAEGGITIGDYTYLVTTGTFNIPGGAVNDGDKLKSTMVGNTLTAWINRGAGWVLIGSASDTSVNGNAKYLEGKPGIGAFKTSGSGNMSAYCFTDFSATDI